MFMSDISDEGSAGTGGATSTSDAGPDGDNSVLELPDGSDEDEDRSGSNSRRRGGAGRDRLGAATSDHGGADGTTARDDESSVPDDDAKDLPSTAVNLEGRRIALVPASASATGSASRAVRVDGISVPCAGPHAAGELAAELALLDRLELQLRRAGAVPVRLDSADHRVPCADRRVALQGTASSFVVLDAAGGGAARVLAARLTRGTTGAAARAPGARLAGEIAAALGLPTPATHPDAAALALLVRGGVVQVGGRAPGALVQLGLEARPSGSRLDEVAAGILAGLAADATAARQSKPGTGTG